VTSLVELHREAAPSGAATTVGHVRRPPERLTRRALAAAREQRLGLPVVASLLERDDDEQLWDEVMAGHTQPTVGTDIVLWLRSAVRVRCAKALVWFPDTSALVSLAVHLPLQQAVQATLSPHRRVLVTAVLAELQELARSTRTAAWAGAALGQLDWLGEPVRLDDPDGTKLAVQVQEHIAAGFRHPVIFTTILPCTPQPRRHRRHLSSMFWETLPINVEAGHDICHHQRKRPVSRDFPAPRVVESSPVEVPLCTWNPSMAACSAQIGSISWLSHRLAGRSGPAQ
jgi:hypothetical protein